MNKLTSTDEKPVSKPGLEESILVSFVDVHVTTEDDFHITRIVQEDQETGTDPQPHHGFFVIRRTLGDYVSEDIWRKI